jgi:hypothetical protein
MAKTNLLLERQVTARGRVLGERRRVDRSYEVEVGRDQHGQRAQFAGFDKFGLLLHEM